MINQFRPSYYIKLGEGGIWERECIEGGFLRFGYETTPLGLCLEGRWEEVAAFWQERSPSGNVGSAKRHANQIQAFFEVEADQVFVTFHDRRLWWCRPAGEVEVCPDGTHKRATIDGWHDRSLGGSQLLMERLSGKLLKTEGFRGTICKVDAHEYLMRKLRDQLSPELEEAERAEGALVVAIEKLISLLTWQDFELLVDLIFSTSGWRRVTQTGGVQKTTDLDLVLPTTGERALVQIKSKADTRALAKYVQTFAESSVYDRMFFVWHSGDPDEDQASGHVVLINPARLARMVVDAGLSAWLRDKAG